ncbi:hypothetical protein [[Eubacterium] cellulosolvens]
MQLDLENIQDNPLWKILVDTVHTMIMYKPHKQYISELLTQVDNVDPENLSLRLGIPLGETLVILKELDIEKKKV